VTASPTRKIWAKSKASILSNNQSNLCRIPSFFFVLEFSFPVLLAIVDGLLIEDENNVAAAFSSFSLQNAEGYQYRKKIR